jgi:hypothetical protein
METALAREIRVFLVVVLFVVSLIGISHTLVGCQNDFVNGMDYSLGRWKVSLNNVGTTKRDAAYTFKSEKNSVIHYKEA